MSCIFKKTKTNQPCTPVKYHIQSGWDADVMDKQAYLPGAGETMIH